MAPPLATDLPTKALRQRYAQLKFRHPEWSPEQLRRKALEPVPPRSPKRSQTEQRLYWRARRRKHATGETLEEAMAYCLANPVKKPKKRDKKRPAKRTRQAQAVVPVTPAPAAKPRTFRETPVADARQEAKQRAAAVEQQDKPRRVPIDPATAVRFWVSPPGDKPYQATVAPDRAEAYLLKHPYAKRLN